MTKPASFRNVEVFKTCGNCKYHKFAMVNSVDGRFSYFCTKHEFELPYVVAEN